MPHYRIYPLNGAGGPGAPVDAECADDSAALLAARDFDERLRHGCEVWELTRFLGRFYFHPARASAQTPDA